MAIADMPVKVQLLYLDEGGAHARSTVNLPSNTDEIAAINFAEALFPLAAAITETALMGVNVVFPKYDDAYPDPPAGSDVEVKGVFILRTADNAKSALATAGIPDEMLIDTGALKGVLIDLTDEDIDAFVDALIDGLTVNNSQGVPTLVTPCDTRGSDYNAVLEAYKQHRRSQKRMGRKG